MHLVKDMRSGVGSDKLSPPFQVFSADFSLHATYAGRSQHISDSLKTYSCGRLPLALSCGDVDKDLGTRQALRNDYQIIAVDDLVVSGIPHRFADLFAVETANAFDIGGRKITQAASELHSFYV